MKMNKPPSFPRAQLYNWFLGKLTSIIANPVDETCGVKFGSAESEGITWMTPIYLGGAEGIFFYVYTRIFYSVKTFIAIVIFIVL